MRRSRRFKIRFHKNALLQVSIMVHCSTLSMQAEALLSSSGQTCSPAPLFDPFKLRPVSVCPCRFIALLQWMESTKLNLNDWALSLVLREMLPEGSNRLESLRPFLEPSWENCEWLNFLWTTWQRITGLCFLSSVENWNRIESGKTWFHSNDLPKTSDLSFFVVALRPSFAASNTL